MTEDQVNDALAETIAEGFEVQRVNHLNALAEFLFEEVRTLEHSLPPDVPPSAWYATYAEFEDNARAAHRMCPPSQSQSVTTASPAPEPPLVVKTHVERKRKKPVTEKDFFTSRNHYIVID